MSESSGLGGSGGQDPRIASSPVVTQVFEKVLDDVITGELQPGQRINDADLAARFAVSRTPVREALQRLREIGVIEASPSRFTRVADVTPAQTRNAYAVWRPLFATLLDEVTPHADESLLSELETHHREYLDAVGDLDARRIATSNFRFFTAIQERSANPILRRALVSVVHIIRLGSLHLPEYIDFTTLSRAQEAVLDAVRDHDSEKARLAILILGEIEIPQE